MEEDILFAKREPDMLRRMRILYVKQFFEEFTDEEHSASMNDIIKFLDNQSIPAERKSINDDIKALIEYGMDIELENGKLRKLLSRDFDLAEIKLIIDCVASSKFLSAEKSKELIDKLGKLVSANQRKALKRQVVVSDRAKSINKTALYNLDSIHTAIASHKCIDFQYYQYNAKKELTLKHDGKVYHVSPQSLLYDNNNYYLLASEGIEPKVFRVDRMTNIIICDSRAWTIKPIDIASFTKSTFGMYQGEKEKVELLFKNEMMDTVIDKFGEDVWIKIIDDNHFMATVTVSVSPQFFAWIFGLGDNVMIKYPPKVVKQMQDLLKERHKAYQEEKT